MRKLIGTTMLAVAAVALAGCGAPRTHVVIAAHHTTAAPSASQSPAQPSPSQSSTYSDTGTADGSLMACGTVVDTDPSSVGFKGNSLTAEQVISYLQAMMLADGVKDIPSGSLTNADSTILSGAAIDLENYSGDQLATDAEQFAQDAQSYTGLDNGGTVDTSYASAVTADIAALMKDCPASVRDALKILHQG